MNWKALFEYRDGTLFNKERPVYFFKTEKDAKSWNTKYSGIVAGSLDRDGYVYVNFRKKHIPAHRVIWEMFNGPIPKGMEIDHIDQDKTNNRTDNLRLATSSQNRANRKTWRTALPKGVYRRGKRFYSTICKDYTTITIGTFDTIEEARAAYTSKGKQLFGDFFSEC